MKLPPIPFEELAGAVLREIGDGPPDGRAPRLPARPVETDAITFCHRTGALHSPVPILAFDFYPKEPA